MCSKNNWIIFFCCIYFHANLKKNVLFIFQENYENSKGEMGDQKYMLVSMSKKVYKEMVNEMNIIALRKDPSQQQRAS